MIGKKPRAWGIWVAWWTYEGWLELGIRCVRLSAKFSCHLWESNPKLPADCSLWKMAIRDNLIGRPLQWFLSSMYLPKPFDLERKLILLGFSKFWWPLSHRLHADCMLACNTFIFDPGRQIESATFYLKWWVMHSWYYEVDRLILYASLQSYKCSRYIWFINLAINIIANIVLGFNVSLHVRKIIARSSEITTIRVSHETEIFVRFINLTVKRLQPCG